MRRWGWEGPQAGDLHDSLRSPTTLMSGEQEPKVFSARCGAVIEVLEPEASSTGKNTAMPRDRTSLILGTLLVAVGSGWLLSSLGFIPSVDWAWSLGLAMVGFLAIVLSGFDKVSFVIAGFFSLASVMSVLRPLGVVRVEVEIPVLVLASGILLVFARSNAIPVPRWIVKD